MEDRNRPYSKSRELQIVYAFLKTNTATASMIEAATGIKHKNICRIKRRLEKEGLLWQVKQIICPVTKHLAWALTTDPKKVSISSVQLKLF